MEVTAPQKPGIRESLAELRVKTKESPAEEKTAAKDFPAEKQEAKPRERPNYFLSIPLSSAKMDEAFEVVQGKLAELDPAFKRTFTEPVTAHITLAVLRLEDDEQVQAAGTLLQDLGGKLSSGDVPKSLHLGPLDSFRKNHEVLFFEISDEKEKEKLKKLSELVRAAFIDKGLLEDPIRTGEQDPLRFHVTVAKTSRLQRARQRGGRTKQPRRFPAAIIDSCKDVDAGQIDNIQLQLCRMGGRSKGQPYHVAAEVTAPDQD